MKNNQLSEGGNITDLEGRLQNQAEFLEMLNKQHLMEEEPLRRNLAIAEQEIDEGSDDETEKTTKFNKRKIEVQKAVRDTVQKELQDKVKDIKTPTHTTPNFSDIKKIDDLLTGMGDEEGKDKLNTVRLRAMNIIFKKYNLPLLTTVMNKEKTIKQIDSNKDKISKFVDEGSNIIKRAIQLKGKKTRLLKAADKLRGEAGFKKSAGVEETKANEPEEEAPPLAITTPKEEEAPAPKIETKKPAASTTVSKTSQPAKELTEEEKKEAQMKADLANATELFGNFFYFIYNYINIIYSYFRIRKIIRRIFN
jgi:hypothetical protein